METVVDAYLISGAIIAIILSLHAKLTKDNSLIFPGAKKRNFTLAPVWAFSQQNSNLRDATVEMPASVDGASSRIRQMALTAREWENSHWDASHDL